MAEPKSREAGLGADERPAGAVRLAEERGVPPGAAGAAGVDRALREGDLPEASRCGPSPLAAACTRERLEAQIRGERRLPHRPLERSRTPERPRTRQGRWGRRSCLGQGRPRSMTRAVSSHGSSSSALATPATSFESGIGRSSSPWPRASRRAPRHPPAPETKDIPLDEPAGYTGTAHALLAGRRADRGCHALCGGR